MQQRPSLFNHFLGAAEQREWESDARAARQRADLLAFLKEATQPGASVAQQGGPMGGGGMSGMMDGGQVPNLKNLDPADRVQEITYCKDSYTVTTANGQTRKFWERNQAPLVVRRSLSMTVSKLLIGFSFVLYVFAFLGQSTDPLLADSTIVPVVTDLPSLKLVEKERRMIGERTRAGLAAAKKRGVKLGSLNAGLSRLKHASVRLLVCSAKTQGRSA